MVSWSGQASTANDQTIKPWFVASQSISYDLNSLDIYWSVSRRGLSCGLSPTRVYNLNLWPLTGGISLCSNQLFTSFVFESFQYGEAVQETSIDSLLVHRQGCIWLPLFVCSTFRTFEQRVA